MVLARLRRLSPPSILVLVFWSVIGYAGGQTVSARQQAPVARDGANEQRGNPVDLKLAQATAIGDFNGDGIADVAVADFVHDVVNVMVRGADGRLVRAATIATGRGPRSIVADDFNHDGVLDLAVASFFSGDVRILDGEGSARFHEAGLVQLAPGIASLSSSLVAANFLSGEVSKLRISATGALEGVETVGDAPGTALLLSTDVDGDGRADLVAVDAAGNSVRLFGATAHGGFEDRGRIDGADALNRVRDALATHADGTSLRALSGDGQTASPGLPLPEALVVEVRDNASDETVSGVPVVFSPVGGFDNTVATALQSDDDGLAELQTIAGRAPGNQFVAVTVTGGNTIVTGSLAASPDSAFRAALRATQGANTPLDAPATRLAIETALDTISAGGDVDGVAALTTMINAASAPEDPVSDVVRRVVNQVLDIGPAASGVDLVETAVSEPPAILTVKQKFVATDTVSNQGTNAAGASTTRYYLSVDGLAKTSRLGGGGRSVPGLAAGANSAGSDTVAVAATMKPGFYFLLACADDTLVVLEDNETNNCRSSIGQVQVKAADLIVTSLSEPPTSGTEGSDITVSDTTKNNGDFAAGNSTTSYYLSLDQKWTKTDTLIASRVVGSLAPGASSSGSTTATLSAPPNAYFLIACADALKKVPESNSTKKGEKNNCLASTGKITVLPSAADGGPTDNGAMSTGRISAAGEIDEWTFTATAGDRIAVHIGEIVDDNDFRPWLRLLSPSDAVLGDVAGVSATVIDDIVAPATGTYKVRVGSFDSGFDGTGSYRLTVVHTPPPITVSAGDQGGPLTNGAIHTGEILQGDVDAWTFTANQGDRIALHIGEITDTDDFRPWLRLWAPNGSTLGDVAGVSATVIDDIVAPVTGTYLVLVASYDSGFDGEGTYRLTMTHTPGPITVSPGDEGGPLTIGAIHQGEITQGDVDVWTFTANQGDRIALHIGEIADTDDFRPWLRLWAPNGATLGDVAGVSATVIDDVVAPVTGTYLVLVASYDSGFDGEGTYRLTLMRTPGPITVSPGDQGGPLTNGATHEGEITQGDVDIWTFNANAGDRIAVHIGEITDTDDFRPWIRLWTQNGATLGDVAGVSATVIDDVVAPITGTYFVLVASYDSGFDGEGTYRLTMTHTPGPITVSPGDQGGPVTVGATETGEITTGDVDVWTVTLNAGDHISVNATETTDPLDFRPWIRVWAPNGATLGDIAGVSSAQITNAVAPVSGTYLILIGTYDSGFDGTGTYNLVVNVSPPLP